MGAGTYPQLRREQARGLAGLAQNAVDFGHSLGDRGQESGDRSGLVQLSARVFWQPRPRGGRQILDAPSRPGDPPGADRKSRTA